MAVAPLCPKDDPVLTDHGVCHTLTLGLRYPDGPGRGLDKVFLPVNPSFGSCLLLCSVLLGECGDAPLMGWWLLGQGWDLTLDLQS